MLDGSLNVAVSPFELIAIKKKFYLSVTSSNWKSLLSCNSINTPSTLTMGSQGFSLWLALVGAHARKDGRTGFSSAAPAALQPLRWPHGVLKRCTCRASTFKMAVQGSQALRLPRFNLLDPVFMYSFGTSMPE